MHTEIHTDILLLGVFSQVPQCDEETRATRSLISNKTYPSFVVLTRFWICNKFWTNLVPTIHTLCLCASCHVKPQQSVKPEALREVAEEHGSCAGERVGRRAWCVSVRGNVSRTPIVLEHPSYVRSQLKPLQELCHTFLTDSLGEPSMRFVWVIMKPAVCRSTWEKCYEIWQHCLPELAEKVNDVDLATLEPR